MANEAQIRAWNEQNAERWLRLREPMTRPLVPFGAAALEALAPGPGERALDVGCGTGDTTCELARRTGSALGVDVCEPFLQVARAEAVEGARYLLADAQTRRFEEKFSLIFSRFGVMFFEDPGAAFANLRSALHPGGRLAAAVWGPWRENEWVTAPLDVLRTLMPATDPAPGPGPFALEDAGSLRRLLEAAGFTRVSVERLERPFAVDAAQLAEQGPAAAQLRQAGRLEELRARFVAGVAERLRGATPRAVALLVTAIRP